MTARDWKPAFLKALAKTGNISEAARAAQVSRTAVYAARYKDEAFASDWDDAVENSTDTLEAIAFKRAKSGSDILLMFLLKSRRPEKYRDRLQVSGDPTEPLHVVIEYADSQNNKA
jgi:hypothetical protein